jgi:CBS domain-containing protein
VHARDLAQDLPVVRVDDNALTAARLIATRRLPAIAVLDRTERPVAVLPASQVLRFLIPAYVQDDPSLARVLDEPTADRCGSELRDRRVGELLPRSPGHVELAAVDGGATVVECAAVMARLRSPLLLVVERGRLLGLLTAAHLLEALLDPPPPSRPLNRRRRSSAATHTHSTPPRSPRPSPTRSG